ncbi:hypothetical protein D3C73_1109160 [compost metagenome]
MLSAGTALNIFSQAAGLWAIFQSPVCQSPPIEQFSKAIRSPLSAARLDSFPNTSANFGMDSSMDCPVSLPVNPDTISAPNKWAWSMSRSQLASVSALSPVPVSGLPKMPTEEMMKSCSAASSRTRAAVSAKSVAPVVCQNVRLKDSKPCFTICGITRTASGAPTSVPILRVSCILYTTPILVYS